MEDFAEAQRLFRQYERDGNANTLEDAIQILEEKMGSNLYS